MAIRTVIIPAAGKGTRLMPATKVTAKELLPVYDRVAIDFAMEEALGAGAERVIVVINVLKTAIQKYLNKDSIAPGFPTAVAGYDRAEAGPEIVYVFQERALGLGDAVLCCKGITLPGPFAVVLPDDIILGENCLADMGTHYAGGHMIAAMQVKPAETSQYGIFRLSGLPKDRCFPVSGMVEKPAPGMAPSSIAAVGRYILDPMIFSVLERTPVGRGGEVQLTDAITIAGHATPIAAFQFSGRRYDCGNHDGLLAASIARQAFVQNHSGSSSPSLAHLSTTKAGLQSSDFAARPAEITA